MTPQQAQALQDEKDKALALQREGAKLAIQSIMHRVMTRRREARAVMWLPPEDAEVVAQQQREDGISLPATSLAVDETVVYCHRCGRGPVRDPNVSHCEGCSTRLVHQHHQQHHAHHHTQRSLSTCSANGASTTWSSRFLEFYERMMRRQRDVEEQLVKRRQELRAQRRAIMSNVVCIVRDIRDGARGSLAPPSSRASLSQLSASVTDSPLPTPTVSLPYLRPLLATSVADSPNPAITTTSSTASGIVPQQQQQYVLSHIRGSLRDSVFTRRTLTPLAGGGPAHQNGGGAPPVMALQGQRMTIGTNACGGAATSHHQHHSHRIFKLSKQQQL
eukprot:PhM_4_TR15975/c0_g1_i1/m.97972